jgi:hypothetical protein
MNFIIMFIIGMIIIIICITLWVVYHYINLSKMWSQFINTI